MAWSDTCKMDAVAQIDKRKEIRGAVRKALCELAKESGIPYGTLRDWYYQNNGVPKIRNKLKPDDAKKTRKIADLNTLTFDSGRKEILFKLTETDGNRFLEMQEYRVGKEGKEIATKNRLIIPLDLIAQFREDMDGIEAMTKGGFSEAPESGGSDPQEENKVEPAAGDDQSVPRDNEVNGLGEKTEPSLAPADGAEAITVEAEFVHCVDCKHFAIKTWAPEKGGPCSLIKGNWNGKLAQSPHEPHPCPNFSLRDQQPG
jgi:hypothetical protein